MILYSKIAIFSGAGSGISPNQMKSFWKGPAATLADPSALAAAIMLSQATVSASSHRSRDLPKPAVGMGTGGLADAIAPGIKTAAPTIAQAALPALNFVPTLGSLECINTVPHNPLVELAENIADSAGSVNWNPDIGRAKSQRRSESRTGSGHPVSSSISRDRRARQEPGGTYS